MTVVLQMKPDGCYQDKDLERLSGELREYLEFPEVMWTDQAAKFLGISRNKLYQMDRLPSHQIPDIIGRVYLRSELIEYIKKH